MAGPQLTADVNARLVEFQRNASFVAFVVVVVLAALMYLVTSVRFVIVPLIWASFFALPLERTASHMNSAVVRLMSCLLRFCTGCRSGNAPSIVTFRHTPGFNRVSIQNTHTNAIFLRRLNEPWVDRCCDEAQCSSIWRRCSSRLARAPSTGSITSTQTARWFRSFGCRCAVVIKCCRRRVRITSLEGTAQEKLARSVNRLMVNWCYYINQVPSSDPAELQMELFLDQGANEYPAVVEGLLLSSDAQYSEEVAGTFEMDRSSPLSWMFTIGLIIVLLLGCVALFAYLLYVSVQSLQVEVLVPRA